MVRIYAQSLGADKVVLDSEALQRLIDTARKVEEVELIEVGGDIPTEGLMRLAQAGGSFDFLNDPREDIYTPDDLKVRYR